MAPELLNSIDAEELRGLAAKIREHQEARKLSDNALFKKYPGIGSTKTFKRILEDDLTELNLERQLANYRSVVALIESVREEENEEELFDDLGPALEVRRAFLETFGETSNARVIIIEGDTGTGKTKSAVLLAQKFGQRILWIEAAAAWGDKPNALLGSILAALGIKPSEWPISQFERLERVVERLKSSRLCVIIDEAHHMGPDCLNTVKTLINRTPGEFILAAMKTLWNRLERDSYQEVKQLTGNRLAERIKLSLRETDVKKLLDRRLAVLPAAESKKALTLLMAKAPHNGNLAFVREVCKRARIMAGADAVTFEIVTSAISAEEGKR